MYNDPASQQVFVKFDIKNHLSQCTFLLFDTVRPPFVCFLKMRDQNKEHNVCFQRRFIGCILVSVALENEVSFDAHWISKAEDGAGRIVMNNNKPCLYSAYHIQREVSMHYEDRFENSCKLQGFINTNLVYFHAKSLKNNLDNSNQFL